MDPGSSFRPELHRVKAALDGAAIQWGVAAGMAVYLYTGNRRPTDLDLLVRPQDLPRAAGLLGMPAKREQTGWGESAKAAAGRTEIVGSLTVRVGPESYPYFMDEEMAARRRMVALEGLEVPVLAPEDVIALKVVLQRGLEQGKHDLEDVEALRAAMPLDRAYLRRRLQHMGAMDRASPIIGGWPAIG